MEFLIDLIGEIIVEGLFELATNRKINKFIRYPLLALFIMLYLGMLLLLILLGISYYKENNFVAFILWGLALGLLIISVLGIRKKMNESE